MDRRYHATFSFGDPLNKGLSTMMRGNIGVMAKRTVLRWGKMSGKIDHRKACLRILGTI
jgi:hypothetical protein